MKLNRGKHRPRVPGMTRQTAFAIRHGNRLVRLNKQRRGRLAKRPS